MAYDTAATIIASAAAECGLTTVADPFSSTADSDVQLCALLTQCGRELYALAQWQQLVRSTTISTGAIPATDGKYDLPTDFGYFINQTGWSPTSGGTGLPLGGPITRQQATFLVATGMSTTVTLFFDYHRNQLCFIPAPAPANIDITYDYMSNGWVQVLGVSANVASLVANASDVVMYEPVMISKMLATRYKQAKGLDARSTLQQFQLMFDTFSGVNRPAPKLSLTAVAAFPYLNPWRNIPNTGYGS